MNGCRMYSGFRWIGIKLLPSGVAYMKLFSNNVRIMLAVCEDERKLVTFLLASYNTIQCSRELKRIIRIIRIYYSRVLENGMQKVRNSASEI